MIRLIDAKKYYGKDSEKVKALNGVNLQIEMGDMIAIMGTSGSGKTTLLNIIGGMDRLTSGEFWFQDQNITPLQGRELHGYRKKNISFVFQNFLLIDRYTVYENIEIPLLARKIGNRKKRIARYLEYLGIADIANKKVTKISGGQQQRCAIARALVADTPIILADEPTGALDQNTSREIMKLLKKINQESGKTVVIVTHDNEVAGYCNQTYRLQDGRIKDEKTNQ